MLRVVENIHFCGASSSLEGLRKLYVEGQLREALQTVGLMQQQGIKVPLNIFFDLLQCCTNKKDLASGKEVSRLIITNGFESNAFLATHVIRMFSLCGNLIEANKTFCKLPTPTVFAWSAVISAHAKLGHGEQGIKLYYRMRQTGLRPNDHVFVVVLKACISTAALEDGKLIHAHTIESGFESNVFVGSTLIDLYAKCGSLDDSLKVFTKLLKRDVVTWNVMIAACAQHGCGCEAVKLYGKMQEDKCEPDSVSFVVLLKAYSKVAAIDQWRIVHVHIIERGYDWDIVVGSTLVDMYGKYGSLEDLHRLFDKMPCRNVVTWNATIAGYAQQGRGVEALDLFQQMKLEGTEPDSVTFIGILKACANLSALDHGQLIHDQVIERGFESDTYVGSTLIDMYCKCGSIEDARGIFDKLPKRSVVTWNSMITGYAKHGYSEKAFQLYPRMQREGLKPDNVTFLSLLNSCSTLLLSSQRQQIHTDIIERGLDLDAAVGSILIDMHTRCGRLEEAIGVFDRLPKRDTAIWNAVIAGYALQNDYKLALHYFNGMQQEGFEPDDVTFVCLLSACGHIGLVDKGFEHFKSMGEKYGIIPIIEHYNCMVNVLGRAGFLEDAKDLLRISPFPSNSMGWRSLLSHCKTYGNVELGRQCFDHLVSIDQRDASGYVQMLAIYVNTNMWEDADKLQELRKCACAWKKPAKAFIEVENDIHGFAVEDGSYPLSDDVYEKLATLSDHIVKNGHVPHSSSAPESLLDDDKQDVLYDMLADQLLFFS